MFLISTLRRNRDEDLVVGFGRRKIISEASDCKLLYTICDKHLPNGY